MTCRTSTLLFTLALTTLAGSIHAQTRLAFVTNNASGYLTLCRKGTEAAAKRLGNVTVRFIMPPNGTAETQKQDIDELVAGGVRGFAVSPVVPQNETAYLSDVAKKVKLITSDSDAAKSHRICYIGTDNYAAGLQAGWIIKAALPHGGQIMLFVGYQTAQNAHESEMSIREMLRRTNITVLVFEKTKPTMTAL